MGGCGHGHRHPGRGGEGGGRESHRYASGGSGRRQRNRRTEPALCAHGQGCVSRVTWRYGQAGGTCSQRKVRGSDVAPAIDQQESWKTAGPPAACWLASVYRAGLTFPSVPPAFWSTMAITDAMDGAAADVPPP